MLAIEMNKTQGGTVKVDLEDKTVNTERNCLWQSNVDVCDPVQLLTKETPCNPLNESLKMYQLS